MAALVVVIYGMQQASAILVPILVGGFLAVICSPFMRWMKAIHIPLGIAVTVVVLAIIGILALAANFVSGQIGEFTDRLPFYEQQINQRLAALATRFGQDVSITQLLAQIQPTSPMALVANLFTGLQGLFAYFFLIIFTVIFSLLEASSFPTKLRHVLRATDREPEFFYHFTSGVQRYLGIKTIVSIITGILAGVFCALVGLDFPLLWGMLAFLLNYVPSIGSLIASIPPVLLAIVQLGPTHATVIAVGYFAINITIGGIIEPRVMGRGLGLSTLVVFLSLVFWGWVFGPVGMLLSVPLTMTLKIALESSERTAPIAILLGAADRVRSL
ncbi:MAG TPA: AI-2E family transporter [Gammaproteobacteria bacterium]